MNNELVFLKSFVITASFGVVAFLSAGFKNQGNQKFTEIDVERINIVEKDGTIKMIITNVDRFPGGNEIINGRMTNVTRKKRSGMLFYNEDGMEYGGFIYDGQKSPDGKEKNKKNNNKASNGKTYQCFAALLITFGFY